MSALRALASRLLSFWIPETVHGAQRVLIFFYLEHPDGTREQLCLPLAAALFLLNIPHSNP